MRFLHTKNLRNSLATCFRDLKANQMNENSINDIILCRVCQIMRMGAHEKITPLLA